MIYVLTWLELATIRFYTVINVFTLHVGSCGERLPQPSFYLFN